MEKKKIKIISSTKLLMLVIRNFVVNYVQELQDVFIGLGIRVAIITVHITTV